MTVSTSSLTSSYITLGRQLRDWMVEEIGVPRERIHPVYNGVDPNRFRPVRPDQRPSLRAALLPSHWPHDATVIGTVGRLSRVKNHHYLIDAFATLLRSRAVWSDRLRLVIVGDGPERSALETLIARSGLEERVLISGYSDQVPSFLACMDLFVLPSHSEGVSNTLLEAQATGLPAVATAVGSTPELVVDGQTAILVDVDDSEALANSISLLLAEPARIRAMGERSRQYVTSRFSWERVAHDYGRVYCKALGVPSRST